MPVYEYIAVDRTKACAYCKPGFEKLETLHGLPNTRCPKCGVKVRRLISAPRVGLSRSGLDDRAKNAGFHKLNKLNKGEYEKEY